MAGASRSSPRQGVCGRNRAIRTSEIKYILPAPVVLTRPYQPHHEARDGEMLTADPADPARPGTRNAPNPQRGDTTMRKLILSALAATALLTAASAANAGYWAPGPFGPVYVPTCVY